MKKLRVAEEVFIAVRALAFGAGRDTARWREFRRAWEVMSNAGFSGINITISDFLRAQVHHGTLRRPKRGLYQFVAVRPMSPYYVKPRSKVLKGPRAMLVLAEAIQRSNTRLS